jgi:hypothetical protein
MQQARSSTSFSKLLLHVIAVIASNLQGACCPEGSLTSEDLHCPAQSSQDAAMAGADDPKLCPVAGFFTLHHIAFALAIILTLLAVILGFIWMKWRENRFAAVLFIPAQIRSIG